MQYVVPAAIAIVFPMATSMRMRIVQFAGACLLLSIGYGARAETLIFSDDFARNELGDAWIPISANGYELSGDRLRAVDNGQTFNSAATYQGDLRIVLDVEKETASDPNHSAWDLAVGLRSPDGTVLGVLRFDAHGVDAIEVGRNTHAIIDSDDPFTIPGVSPNLGQVTFTYQDSEATIEYQNVDGTILSSAAKRLPIAEPYQLYLNVAAFPDSARYVDNFRVYQLPIPEPTTGRLIACGLWAIGSVRLLRRS